MNQRPIIVRPVTTTLITFLGLAGLVVATAPFMGFIHPIGLTLLGLGCSFFLSVISAATEGDANRYCHKERRWAAQRHVNGFVFYIPVVIDDTPEPTLEPPEFAEIHFDRLIRGVVTPSFAARLS